SFLKEGITQVGEAINVKRVSLQRFAVALDRLVELAFLAKNIPRAKVSRREIRIVPNGHLEAPQRRPVVPFLNILPAELNRVRCKMLAAGNRLGLGLRRRGKSNDDERKNQAAHPPKASKNRARSCSFFRHCAIMGTSSRPRLFPMASR